MEWFIIMEFMPIFFLGIGLVLLIVIMLRGFYLVHKKQNELLRLSVFQEERLNGIVKQSNVISEIARQTSAIVTITDQFKTPQYLAQFTVTLKNKKKDVLRLGDIVYVRVKMKTLHIYTVQQEEYKMDANLREVVEGPNPILPPMLFVRINKSEIVNVLYVKNTLSEEVKITGIRDGLKTLSLTAGYKTKAIEVFSLRDL